MPGCSQTEDGHDFTNGKAEQSMKTGRISESILKRSILRQIKTHRDEVLKGAGVGEDCAFFSWDQSVLAVSTETITLPVGLAPELAVLAAVNNLAAGGAGPFAITAAVTLPAESEEACLKEIMSRLENACKELRIELSGGHTEVSPAVKTPVISVTAFGKKPAGALQKPEAEKAQTSPDKQKIFDIVVSKWIGLEGTVILAEEKKEELLSRYPQNILLVAQDLKRYLSVLPEAALADESDVYMMHDIRSGGIFGALWEISRRMGVGLTIDLKKIPIRQETIEICEFFELNPYVLLSGGGLLMLTQNGKALVKKLEEAGISATVIGSTNSSNDKLVINEEETRYLEPPVPDEIYKVFYKA